ncbi:flavodoxin [Alistipes sp.]|uniref:flavodoxin n=1 Tax=Alistipes sp. TaxID=1872444 RepID=UPI0025C2AEEB|nr:flavodoxin [Alistipes sp.]
MTGIFFGSTTGTTEAVAQDIARLMGISASDIHNVADVSPEAVAPYDLLILGSSTWGCGELQDDWYGFLENLKTQNLSGKRVALFGCGDSGSYPDTFCDAVGLIFEALQATGCTFVGSCASEGYEATNSLICNEGQFLGLAVDESAPEKTDSRIAAWCEQLKNS